MLALVKYLGGAFLGWSLGANDSANVFGTAVSSRMVSYKLAIILTAVFVLLGSVLQGQAGIKTLSEDLKKNAPVMRTDDAQAQKTAARRAIQNAMIASFSAALTVTLMTIIKIPVSSSQAVVGAIVGVGMMMGDINFSELGSVVVCWLLTPVGGAAFTFVFYRLFKILVDWWRPSVFVYDPVMSLLLIVSGCYGAYALGANNVANVGAVFVGENMLTPAQASWFGGLSIAAGVLTFSKPVMTTIGNGIVKLNALMALVCVLSEAVTVHIFAVVGVPVSTSQAIIGALLGIGLIKGAHVINYRTLAHVSLGWLATPFVGGVLAALMFFISNLKYSA